MWFGVAAITIGFAFASYGRRRGSGHWLTDGNFVLTVLGPVIVASMSFTAAVASIHEPHLSLAHGAIGGALCYAAASLLATLFLRGCRNMPPTGAAAIGSDSEIKDLISWMIAGAIAGFLLALGMRFGVRPQGDFRSKFLTISGSSWIMLSIFGGELVYVGLRSYAKHGDMDREWLGRAAGWLTAGAAGWAIISAVALFGPYALDRGMNATIGSVAAAGGVSGIIALGLGSSAKTAATNASQVARRLSLTQIATIAGAIFAVFLAICLSQLDGLLSGVVTRLFSVPWEWAWIVDAGGFILLIVASTGISRFINVNRFSLHALYRNRLVRAFLGSARASARPPRTPDPFTGFDLTDNIRMADAPTNGLLHVINITLNVVSTKNLAWQERKAESFTVTPLTSGNPNAGYRPTREYGSHDGGITLGTAMAISGAAVSPNMGYHSSPLLGFLMMLFNVRLGWWLGNPARETYRHEGPRFAIIPLLKELVGRTTDQGAWVYLSDGGHFENLGVYEMIRRRCRVIVVSDASGDPDCAFEDLGNALRKIYIDLGVSIDFETLDFSKRQTPPKAGFYCALGEITYPGSTVPGWLLYIKPGYHGDEPADIRSYALAHDTFPHETTANQWFSESQFEAYRGLGAHIAELICNGGTPVPAATRPDPIDLAILKTRASNYTKPPEH